MKTMTQNWINFASSGDPGPFWTPIGPDEKEKFVFWNISSVYPEMTYSKNIKKRMELWDHVLLNGSVSNKNFKIYWLLYLYFFNWKIL